MWTHDTALKLNRRSAFWLFWLGQHLNYQMHDCTAQRRLIFCYSFLYWLSTIPESFSTLERLFLILGKLQSPETACEFFDWQKQLRMTAWFLYAGFSKTASLLYSCLYAVWHASSLCACVCLPFVPQSVFFEPSPLDIPLDHGKISFYNDTLAWQGGKREGTDQKRTGGHARQCRAP